MTAGPWAAILACALATYLWRAGGVALAARLDLDSPALRWFGCVAYALVAGLVARLIVLPAGPLAGMGLGTRLTATAIGIAVFAATGRSLLAGVAAGAAALAGLAGLGL